LSKHAGAYKRKKEEKNFYDKITGREKKALS